MGKCDGSEQKATCSRKLSVFKDNLKRFLFEDEFPVCICRWRT